VKNKGRPANVREFLRRAGERDAIDGIIDYDGIHYDNWLSGGSEAA
jgi:hypothetical protein